MVELRKFCPTTPYYERRISRRVLRNRATLAGPVKIGSASGVDGCSGKGSWLESADMVILENIEKRGERYFLMLLIDRRFLADSNQMLNML